MTASANRSLCDLLVLSERKTAVITPTRSAVDQCSRSPRGLPATAVQGGLPFFLFGFSPTPCQTFVLVLVIPLSFLMIRARFDQSGNGVPPFCPPAYITPSPPPVFLSFSCLSCTWCWCFFSVSCVIPLCIRRNGLNRT